MTELIYNTNELYFCKYATAESIKLVNINQIKIKAINKKTGVFVKLNEKEYKHISSGEIIKATQKPTAGQTWIREVIPAAKYFNNAKTISFDQIVSLENKMTNKTKTLKNLGLEK